MGQDQKGRLKWKELQLCELWNYIIRNAKSNNYHHNLSWIWILWLPSIADEWPPWSRLILRGHFILLTKAASYTRIICHSGNSSSNLRIETENKEDWMTFDEKIAISLSPWFSFRIAFRLKDREGFDLEASVYRTRKWPLWRNLRASPLLRDLAQTRYSWCSRQGFRSFKKWKTKGTQSWEGLRGNHWAKLTFLSV